MKRLFLAALLFASACDQVPADDQSADQPATVPGHPEVTLLGPTKMDKEVVSISKAVIDGRVNVQFQHTNVLDPFWDSDNINLPFETCSQCTPGVHSPQTQTQECSDMLLDVYGDQGSVVHWLLHPSISIGPVGAYRPPHIGVTRCSYTTNFYMPAYVKMTIEWTALCAGGFKKGYILPWVIGGYGALTIPAAQNIYDRNYSFVQAGAFQAKSAWRGMLDWCQSGSNFYNQTSLTSCFAFMGGVPECVTTGWQ